MEEQDNALQENVEGCSEDFQLVTSKKKNQRKRMFRNQLDLTLVRSTLYYSVSMGTLGSLLIPHQD